MRTEPWLHRRSPRASASGPGRGAASERPAQPRCPRNRGVHVDQASLGAPMKKGRGRQAIGPDRGHRAVGLLGLVVVASALSACGLVTNLLHTQTEIQNAGYSNATVGYRTARGVMIVTVTADPNNPVGTSRGSAKSTTALAAETRGVASVVWQTLPGSFDELSVTIRGLGTQRFSQAELTSLFGARPSTLDRTPLAGQAARSGAIASAILLVAVVLIACLVLVFWIRVRRGRRLRQRQQAALMMTTLPPEVWELAEAGSTSRARPSRRGRRSSMPGTSSGAASPILLGWPPPQPGFAPTPQGGPTPASTPPEIPNGP